MKNLSECKEYYKDLYMNCLENDSFEKSIFIRAQHDGKIYREVITFTDLDKNGNKIIVELLRGRRGKAEYIAVDVTRLDGEGVYTGAMDLNPQVERQERNINGVKCVNYVVVPGWRLAPTVENKKKILDEIARRAFS